MKTILAFLADRLRPRCFRCGHRARGWRTALEHLETSHGLPA